MDQTPKKALTVKEFCAAYSVCRATLYNEVKRGRLSLRKVGRRTLVRVEDAESWLRDLPRFQ